MTIRSLAVYLDEDADPTRLATLAVELARTLRAGLIGIATASLKPLTRRNSLSLNLSQAQERELTQALQQMETKFRAQARELSVEWRSAISEDPTDFILRQAVLADLILVEHRSEQRSPLGKLDTGRLVLEAGRRVLILPPHTDKLAFDRILLAYKPVREGRAAIQAALPLLRLSRRVLIVGVGQEVSPSELEDVARHLRTHEIEPAVHHVADVKESVSATLFGVAADEGSQLLVSGAYGRGRAREFLFGGVTRDLLSSSRISCLLVH